MASSKKMKTWTLPKTGHTVGNPLTKELLKNKDVVFAAYTRDHPLRDDIRMKVQTKSNTTPERALTIAAQSLHHQAQRLERSLRKSLIKYQNVKGAQSDPGNLHAATASHNK